MTHEPEYIESFRADIRVLILETLILRTALSAPILSGKLSVAHSEQGLLDWLDSQKSIADSGLGRHFREPAMTALYSEVVSETIEAMKRQVRLLAEEAAAIYGYHREP